MTPSVGVSFYPDHGSEPEELLRKADMAMYSTKAWPGVRAGVYTERLGDRAARQLTLSEGLKASRDFDEFHVHYQPFVDLADGRVVGAEALLRWEHPLHGRISPAEFIPLLERTELIARVGEWLIHEACGQAQRWREMGPSDFTIAVNVSPTQLYAGNLRGAVDQALRASALPASLLTLELTETALIDEDHAGEVVPTLAGGGVQLAVDDFGTGYSALRYLSRFPLQILKIDQAFIATMEEDPTTAALVRAMVDIGRVLGMTVVAEGVETPAQARALRESGCRIVQGYCFSKPLAADQFTRLLQQRPFLTAEVRGKRDGQRSRGKGVATEASPDSSSRTGSG